MSEKQQSGKLGFWGLTALVFSLMVGAGIYNLPQNMASVASPGAVFTGWLVTAAGLLPLVISFKWLSNRYPQYNAGIYQYAQAGFGNYAGFNIAWGYWLCTAFANVAYGVMLNDTCGSFCPVLLRHGWETVLFGSCLIWLMFYIVARGVRTAKTVNNLLAGIKVTMIIFIIAIFILFFKADLFDADVWGGVLSFNSLASQVKSTMMITLFCFIGVEGAVMMSARARRSSDVGRAGIVGFLFTLVLYMAVSLLCYGIYSRARLEGLSDPSVAYILRYTCGDWAYWLVIVSVIISLLGGWVAWTLIVAQVPYEASIVGILPPAFLRLNHHGMPTFGLIASSIVMEVFLLMVVMADDVYLAALRITGLMIIPSYFFTGLFMLKKADSIKVRVMAWITVLFCLWMAYSGGVREILLTAVFYIAGLPFYLRARQAAPAGKRKVFTPVEMTFFILILVSAVISVAMSVEAGVII